MDCRRQCDSPEMADVSQPTTLSLKIHFIYQTQLQLQQQLDTCTLELAYEKTLLHTITVCCEEETRQYRLQILLLKCEKDDLHNSIGQSNNRVNKLECYGMQIKNQLDETSSHLEKSRLDLRVKSRDTEMLTVRKTFASYEQYRYS